MIDRTPISKITDTPLTLRRLTPAEAMACGITRSHCTIGLFGPQGGLVAFMDDTEIFDTNGNRFEVDI